MELAPATIRDTEHPVQADCMFNPKEYSLSKQNSWSGKPTKGTNLGLFEFGSGQAETLTVQLFFDTYANIKNGSSTGGTPKDVRKYTAKIWKMMQVDTSLSNLNDKPGQHSKNKKGRPPVVVFQWGSTLSFKAVITSMKERFTLFLPDGTPVRSTLDVTFQQVQDKGQHPPTNPTSGGIGGERVWTVSEGDTLAWIAYQQYGDANRWRLIADANRLTKVRQLTPGMILEIPSD
jgi:nucleoid-associated protein YgaU